MSARNSTASAQQSNKRALNACRACRQRKVKCSGASPCQHCVNRNEACLYDEAEKRVIVTERHLRNLERRATRLKEDGTSPPDNNSKPLSATPVGAPADRNFQSLPPEVVPSSASGPENAPAISAGAGSVFPSKPRIQNIFTWGLSDELRRLLGMPQRKQHDGPTLPRPDLVSLPSALVPSRERILQLICVVDFHFKCQFGFRYPSKVVGLLEDESHPFPDCLDDTPRSCIAHLFAILAFGSLLAARSPQQEGFPGMDYFVQSVHMLPSNVEVTDNDLGDVAATNYVFAMYAQAVSLDYAAYLYAGQASRLVRSIQPGGNIEVEEPVNDSERLYCFVSMLDIRLSAGISLAGERPFEHELDKRAGRNSLLAREDCDGQRQETSALSIHLVLAHILAKISKAISTKEQDSSLDSAEVSDSFFDTMHAPLTTLQTLSGHIHQAQRLCHHASLSTISRTATTAHLAYCQGVMYATKPLLLFYFKATRQRGDANLSVSPQHHRALNSCAKAAVHSLNILAALLEQDYIEAFSPIDLEVAFMSAVILRIIDTILPIGTEDSPRKDIAPSVLEQMAQRGNAQAMGLSEELAEIGKVLDEMPRSSSNMEAGEGGLHIAAPRRVTDGLVLNDAILSIVQIDESAGSDEKGQPAEETLGTSADPISTTTILGADLTFDMLFDSTDNNWNFGSEDLQWLDSVL